MDHSCFYCQKDSNLDKLMIKIKDLQVSTLYLNRDQTHYGRAILSFKDHKREVFELPPIEQEIFFKDLALAAQVIHKVCKPDKINYAIYGDIVSHLHVHLVPKYIEGANWGEAFENNPSHPNYFPELDNRVVIERIIKQFKEEEKI